MDKSQFLENKYFVCYIFNFWMLLKKIINNTNYTEV